MTGHDKELLDKIMSDKERYKVYVDNDSVFVIEKEHEQDDNCKAESFDEFGYHLLESVFQYLGLDAEQV